jgi:phosphoribosylanthranilate isomerase
MHLAQAKICGLSDRQTVGDALAWGAAFIGFVTFPESPRHILPADARPLAKMAAGMARTVSVVVDPDDVLLDQVLTGLRPDFLQLQGSESPERCAAIKARGVGIIRAFGISQRQDLEQIKPFLAIVDYLLFDAKAPKDATRPGGLGHVFDWTILQDFQSPMPWFLSGGLTPENVAQAVRQTGAPLVDVSSGVERAPGLKDNARIASFMQALND